MWKAQFKAYAHHKRFLAVLLGTEEAKPENKELTDKEEIRVRKANDAAYASLIMACKSGAFGHVNSARNEDFPNGSARLAWEKLVKVYESNTMSDMVDLMDKWSKCVLEGDSNPDVWFNELAQIRERLKKSKAPISDETMVAHVITKLPEAYRPLVVGLKLSSTSYEVEQIEKEIRDFWNRYVKSEAPSGKGGVALYGEAKFKGNCRKCGKYGHKAADCRSTGNGAIGGNEPRGKGTGGKTRKDIECFKAKCKKKGHFARDCRGGAPKQENGTAVEGMFVGTHYATEQLAHPTSLSFGLQGSNPELDQWSVDLKWSLGLEGTSPPDQWSFGLKAISQIKQW